MEAEIIIPSRPEQLAAHTAFAAILADKGGDHTAEHAQVLPSRAVFQMAVVLPENYIQHPVQSVFDAPVSAGGAAKLRGRAAPAADIVGLLMGLLVTDPPRPRHADNRLQVHPLFTSTQSLQVVQHATDSLLLASMAPLLANPQVVGEPHIVGRECGLELGDQVGLQGGLVALDLQQVIGLGRADGVGDFLLAAHGVNRYQRALQFQQFEQLGNGGDLVGLVLDRDLSQGQEVGPHPGTDQMQTSAVQATTATLCLAIDLDVLETQAATNGIDPGRESVLEGGWAQVTEQIAEGIVGGDAAGQSQPQRTQP